MNRDGFHDATKMLIWPQYEKDKRLNIDREKNIPPASLFMPLGWDEDATTKRKHYRHYYDDELENVEEFFENKSPFMRFGIKRGQSRGLSENSGLFSFLKTSKKDESGAITNEEDVGYFKGVVAIQSKTDEAAHKAKLVEVISEVKKKLNTISQ